MKVLVGCESSGVVREAFRARGHQAWSCDLLPADDGSPYHRQMDVREAVTRVPWDLLIVHPPCTYLCSSGLHWNDRGRGWGETEKALEFVRWLLDLPIPKIALENPQGCIGTQIRKASQYIQPYQFGHDASKKTGLWLKGLPLLQPTQYVAPRSVCPRCKDVQFGDLAVATFEFGCGICSVPAKKIQRRWNNQTDSGQNNLGPSEDRWKERSKTYRGIAEAMAAQWG